MNWMTPMVAALSLTALAFPQTESSSKPAAPSTKLAKPTKAWGLTWQPDVESALKLAKKQNRPVVWFRVLGELAGGC